MYIDQLRDHCLHKKGVTESFPFDEHTLVFKVMGKMFALIPLKKWEAGEQSVNLKCDPERSIELRETYAGVSPGFHMDKLHWNTVRCDLDVSPKLIMELTDHSYELVVAKFPKKLKAAFDALG